MDWVRLTINEWINIPPADWAILPLYWEPDAGETPDIIYKDLYICPIFTQNLYTKASFEDIKYITRTHSYGVYTNIGVASGLYQWYNFTEEELSKMTASDWNIFYAQSGLCFFNIYNKDLHVKT